MASGAGRYNPLFYGAIGLPSLLFDGASSLYAMRVAAAVLCSVFLGLAGWSLTRWSRTRWPAVGLVATITPVAVYSTAVAAPNGIEMCSALAVWCALLGLTRDHLDSPRSATSSGRHFPARSCSPPCASSDPCGCC